MGDNNAIVINVQQLRYRYASEQQNLLYVPHWQVNKGESVFLYGASGSGKTTLLNLLAGIMLPVSGNVNILGHNTSAMSGRKRDAFRAKHIGVVFQQFNLIPYLSVLDNIRLAAYFAATDKQLVEQRAVDILQGLRLSPQLLTQRADRLSVGQQQRIAIARALINQPQLLIADEPSSALDSDSRDDFMQLLLDCVAQQNSTLVFVSHDKSLATHFSRVENLSDLNQAGVDACY